MRDMPFVAESAAMRPVMQFIERVGPTDANVLILGENGTGKGVIARMLHDNSLRKEAAFLKVNMGGISDTVFESEMFGHVRGAFTDAKSNRMGRFEIADGGTLFLDEIGNVPPAQQPKLLRVLEDGEYEPLGSSVTQRADVRLISATNENLVEAIRAGNFRQDLLYRLNTMELRLPALRERRDDLVPLARAYMEVHAERYGKHSLRLSPRAERMLLQYNWPGNIRELSHVMERAVLLAEHNEIDEFSYIGDETSQNRLADMTLAEAEEWLVRRALDNYPGQLSRAADKLGLTRQALYRRMEKFGIATLEEE
jgi:DNA-binding NtrC family response regulator